MDQSPRQLANNMAASAQCCVCVKNGIPGDVRSLRDVKVACSTSDRHDSNFEPWILEDSVISPSTVLVAHLAYMCTKVA